MTASAFLGSPQRETENKKLINISPMKQRYLDSLKDTGLMVEPVLKLQSASKINIISNTNSQPLKSPTSPLKGLTNFSAKSRSSSKFNSPKKPDFKNSKNNNFVDFFNSSKPLATPSKEKSPNFLQFSGKASKSADSPFSFKEKISYLNEFDPSNLSLDDNKCYSFLCRVTEAIQWINEIVSETDLPALPYSPYELVNKNLLKNGVYLATVVKVLESDKNVNVQPADCKFPYLLVENIELFLHFCYKMKIPEYFKFESVDLFEGKNFSNVIETIHCLAYYLNKSNKYNKKIVPMKKLYGSLQFTKQDFTNITRKLSVMGGLKTFEFFDEVQDHKSPVANKYTLYQEEDTFSDFDSARNSKLKVDLCKTPVKQSVNTKPEDKLWLSDTQQFTSKNKSDVKFVNENELGKKFIFEDEEAFEHQEHTPDVFTTSILNQINNDIETRKRQSFNTMSSNPYQESKASGITLTDNNSIPSLTFKSTDDNDLAYYARSVTSQFSSPRRRRRRARLAGNFDAENESLTSSSYTYDDKSDYSTATYVSKPDLYSLPTKSQHTTNNAFETCVTQFQSLVRASTVRFKKFDLDSRFDIFEENIVLLQSQAKGYLARHINKNAVALTSTNDQVVVVLQSLLKGNHTRDRNNQLLFALLKNKYSISTMNDNIKGCLVRHKVISVLSRQRLYMPFVLTLQSQIKGNNMRKKIMKTETNDNSLVFLQALLKSNLIKNKIDKIHYQLQLNKNDVINAQSAIRGVSVRDSATQISSFVKNNHPKEINSLVAYIKGAFLRNRLYKKMYELELLEPSCVSLQSCLKGLLVRYYVGVVTDYVGINETDIVVTMQSSIKGFLVRRNIINLNKYYIQHKKKIILVQKRIKSYQLSSAYRDVIDSTNPKLKSLSKFVHVLNGTTPVHELEDKLNNLKDVIDSTNLEISKKEKTSIILAKKLMILKENVDSVELLDDKNGSVHKVLSSLSHTHSTGFGKSLASIEIMKSYEKLLYLLQNDPFYFRVLYNKNPAKIEKYIKLIFYQNNGVINKRESILIVKLISEFLSFDIERHSNIEDFLFDQDMNIPWKKLLHTFLLATKREYMNFLLFQTVSKLKDMSETEHMSFESDPIKIYQKLNGSVPAHMSPQEAIQIPDVNKNYVSNMISLWSFIEEIQQVIIDNLDCLPIEILHLSTKTNHIISTKSGDEFDALEGISKILIGGFVNDYLLNAGKYNASLRSESQEFNNNIKVLSNSISTVFAMRKFKGYYQQLNAYVEEIGNDIASILSSLVIPPDFQNIVDNMVYKDMSMVKSPLLIINAKYLIEIKEFFEDNIDFLPESDPILDILASLTEIEDKSNGNNIFKNSAQVINLHLNPSSYVLSDVSNRTKPIYNTVLWGIVILLQIVDAKYFTNILDMLTHDDTDAEEIDCENKLKSLLEFNPKIVQTNIALNNRSTENYFDLKMNVTEKLLELDRLGLIDKSSKYQSLINDIASNLKAHQYFKDKNLKEIGVLNDTIKILTDKLLAVSQQHSVLENSFDYFLKNLKPNFNNSGSVKKNRLMFKSSKDKHKIPSISSLQRDYTLKTLYEQKILIKFKGLNSNLLPINFFGAGGVKYPHISFTISTNDAKTYILNMKKKDNNTQDKLFIVDVLNTIVGDSYIECLDGEVCFDSSKLFNLLIKDFVL
ncbi:hypothetical protein QEN19_000317 [Hanseniaspora menglaensis]